MFAELLGVFSQLLHLHERYDYYRTRELVSRAGIHASYRLVAHRFAVSPSLVRYWVAKRVDPSFHSGSTLICFFRARSV